MCTRAARTWIGMACWLLLGACNRSSDPASSGPVGSPESTDAGAVATATEAVTAAAQRPGATATGTPAPAPTSTATTTSTATAPAPTPPASADAGAAPRILCGDRFPACPAGTTCVMGPRVGTCQPKK